ncbi:MAG TPA: hypothetical protein VG938_07990 [Verrucomicrobiae bacterium]|jgi:hypothetical protein|nr:hypothetical protein [Verrucomicrobiae bacterium]
MNQGNSTELTREELYDKVWSQPTTKVAAELGISDVALSKRCKKLQVPKPPPGYWAKVEAGQKPPKIPLPPKLLSPSEILVQTAEKPLPKTLAVPDTTEQLHPLATELLQTLKTAKPSYDKRIWSQGLTLPEVKVGKGSIEQAAKCFHVIVTQVEAVGIPFRKAQGYHNPGFFKKGNDRLYFKIEEELIDSPEAIRRRSWHSTAASQVPSGKFTFSIYRDRYSSKDVKQWKDDGKSSLGTVLAEIVGEIRGCFVAAIKRREQEAIEREKQRIESTRHWKEYQEREAIRLAEERKQKHAAALEATAHVRSEDFIKAAEWWRLHRVAMEFIEACEQRWRGSQEGNLTPEQVAWLEWAQENAKGMSPFESGYPDAVKDGPFDSVAVPFGGPYPEKRDFPRPPTMPKIPAPVIQQSHYPSENIPQPKQQFPFWLKYQGRK